MRLFYKNNGTISVFLCLILLPVLLVGGMTVDASRIYMSKAVISDAGEMAMNAGLAQYNNKLHDEYGLLVMDKSPQAMEGDLEAYFNASLNGMGISGAEDYEKILDLLTKSFEAINVQGSEIYRTEVEKQQILEYMKYRAPVCITDLVLKKFQNLKDTKKMTEAMEAKMDFSESMEDCQDAFHEAKDALDVLNQAIESFPSPETIEKELSKTEEEYKNIVSMCLLMREVIQNYDGRAQSTDLKLMADGFIDAAEKINLSSPYSQETFENYIDSMYYQNTVEHLGGIGKLLDDYDEGQESEDDTENTEKTDGSGGDDDKKELEELVNKYKELKASEKFTNYLNTLLSTAKNTVSQNYNKLLHYWNTADTAIKAAESAQEKLKKVEEKLEKALEDFEVWDTKNDALKSVGKSGDMDEEVKDYRDFLYDGEGKSNLENLRALKADVEINQAYFEEWKKALEEEKFFDQSIAKTEPENQTNRYRQEAESAVRGISADYSSVQSVWNGYIDNYDHAEVSNTYTLKPIKDNPFYKKIQEYCNEENKQDSQEEQDKANENLDQSKTAGEEAKKEDRYPNYNWGTAGVTLPSSLLSASPMDADEALTDLNADVDVNNSNARKDIISKFRKSIKEASSFLDGVDKILENALENLYIAEYAMQMFSYYTVDKTSTGGNKPDSDIIGISGYPLKNHAAYRAETEYILWGDQSSQGNIRNTVMLIFGIRLLFNCFFAFTNNAIIGTAQGMASLIAGAAPYLIPIVQIVIQLGFAGAETASDISKLTQGYGVTILKDAGTWSTFPLAGDNTKKITFDYSEYLRIFLNVSLLGGAEDSLLARIADCIQVNEPSTNLAESYTMLSVQADVKARTTFLRKISDWGESGSWGFPDDSYTITYQSILGY